MLAESEIDVLTPPEVFASVIPPERRRSPRSRGCHAERTARGKRGWTVEIGVRRPRADARALSQGTAPLDSRCEGLRLQRRGAGVEPRWRARCGAIEPPTATRSRHGDRRQSRSSAARGSRDSRTCRATSLSTSSAKSRRRPQDRVGRLARHGSDVTPRARGSVPVREPAPPALAADAPLPELGGGIRAQLVAGRSRTAALVTACATPRRGRRRPLLGYVARGVRRTPSPRSDDSVTMYRAAQEILPTRTASCGRRAGDGIPTAARRRRELQRETQA